MSRGVWIVEVEGGRKRFEWRRDDRGFEVGDVLVLKLWDPAWLGGGFLDYPSDAPRYTQRVRVTYILRGMFDVPANFCVMSIEPALPPTSGRGEP